MGFIKIMYVDMRVNMILNGFYYIVDYIYMGYIVLWL